MGKKTKNNKIDWIIHYVLMDDKKNEYLVNANTHGLDKHNHRELCMVLNVGQQVCGEILNSIGSKIAFSGKKYEEGFYEDILQDGYKVEIMSLPEDPLLYVIFPDENHRFPSDKDCQYPYNKQYEYAKIISADNKTKGL